MLNEEMKSDLFYRIVREIYDNDEKISNLPYPNAVSFTADLVVEIFANYVGEFDEDNEDDVDIMEFLEAFPLFSGQSFWNNKGQDEEVKQKIAETTASLDKECNECGYPPDDEEGCQVCRPDINKYVDNGDIVWYSSAEEALLAATS